MSLPIKYPSLRTWCLPFISALAMILAAAAIDPDQNWARLRRIADERRAKLVENLKKFDLLYSRPQQDLSASSTEKSTSSRPTRAAHYLGVLARYHNWLNQLPEPRKTSLADCPRLSEWPL